MLEETKGLSDAEKNELMQLLRELSQEKKGQEIIYDLAQTVESFLHKHNKAPSGSFYDQMLIEKLRRDEALFKQQAQNISQEQQLLRDEVSKRKEILRNEDHFRRDTRRTISESSPTHRINSSVEIAGSSIGYLRERVYPNECHMHSTSEDLYFSNVGRKIRKGCCLGLHYYEVIGFGFMKTYGPTPFSNLGHSQKGCVAFSGIDSDTGQLLYITEWNIRHSSLETKCTINCNEIGNCNGHSVDEILQSIEKQVLYLSQLQHKNLISYECVLFMKKKEGILVYLVQDFVIGTSTNSISNSLGWSNSGVSTVAKGILEALIFLHNKGVSHSNLDDSSVFIDNSGTCRVADFSLIPYLSYLVGNESDKQGDLPALGSLIESLLQIPTADMYDFIEKCKSERTLSASDLSEHPFLLPIENTSTQVSKPAYAPDKKRKEMPIHQTVTTGRSRIHTEFEVLQWLGQGAYGDVLKVKNILDNRQYAIKRIPLTSRSRQIFKKMTREVELLSRLNHENVVRYFNSWIESASESELEKYSALRSADEEVSRSLDSDKQVCVVPSEAESSMSSDWMGTSYVSSFYMNGFCYYIVTRRFFTFLIFKFQAE